MIKHSINCKTSIEINESYEGETLEQKIERIVENNEPITDGAPIIYTDRKEGVLPEYNIRTDRWDVAQNAMDYVSASMIAKRDDFLKSNETEPGTGVNTSNTGGDPVNLE